MTGARWLVVLTDSAKGDYADILRWTLESFGVGQAEAYEVILTDAIDALGRGPSTLGVRRRDDVAQGLMTLHIGKRGRKARHLLVFRRSQSPSALEVLRILHDSMDIGRHVGGEADDA